jgi:hypothetical protein
MRLVALSSLAVLGVGLALAGERGREVLEKHLATFRGAERGRIIAVVDDAVAGAFPQHLFYVVRFRQYPVAVDPPEPLGANNLFVVTPGGAAEHLRDASALEHFFRAALAPVMTETLGREAARAWLRLALEFRQDGMFEFSIPEQSLVASPTAQGGLHVTGRALVEPRGGNSGEIVASLTFDHTGQLTGVAETINIQRGLRPICQATKLLDPDPIVRGMAEQTILVMGRAASDYLAEQRAQAGPELRDAIDRIWQRILAESR